MFEGLKIVELASVLAGPLVGSFFAELGAEVIKIENKTTHGDVTRTWKLPHESKESSFSSYYAAANYGKRVLFLDAKNPTDFNMIIDLIKDADIVLTNFKPGDAEKLKLDAKTLRKNVPSLIYAEITGFGTSDKRTAFDVVLQAETGFMSINGERDARPLKMPVALIDILAAHQLKEGILCAYIERLKTGKGSTVSVSLYDAAIASLANQASNFLMTGHQPNAMGSEHPNIAPYGDLFQTSDSKWLVLAVGSDKQFSELCRVLDLEKLAQDERFTQNLARVRHRLELNVLLENKIKSIHSSDIEKKLIKENIPFGLVKSVAEVLSQNSMQHLVLEDRIDGSIARRVRTSIFKLS